MVFNAKTFSKRVRPFITAAAARLPKNDIELMDWTLNGIRHSGRGDYVPDWYKKLGRDVRAKILNEIETMRRELAEPDTMP